MKLFLSTAVNFSRGEKNIQYCRKYRTLSRLFRCSSCSNKILFAFHIFLLLYRGKVHMWGNLWEILGFFLCQNICGNNMALVLEKSDIIDTITRHYSHNNKTLLTLYENTVAAIVSPPLTFTFIQFLIETRYATYEPIDFHLLSFSNKFFRLCSSFIGIL